MTSLKSLISSMSKKAPSGFCNGLGEQIVELTDALTAFYEKQGVRIDLGFEENAAHAGFTISGLPAEGNAQISALVRRSAMTVQMDSAAGTITFKNDERLTSDRMKGLTQALGRSTSAIAVPEDRIRTSGSKAALG